jgi:DNA-binding MarR family transcriptional regulator
VNIKANKEEQLTLELLDAVGKNSDVSQRHLARHMGVALGLANSYLKRCIRKGFIKISDAPANRYLYYLTPKGFAEKSRLTAKYLSTSLAFYRQAGASCLKVLRACESLGWNKIILCGVSDLAEIASLRALEANVEILGNYDPHSDHDRFMDKPVWHVLKDAGRFDGCMLTDLRAPRLSYEHLLNEVGPEHVLVPDILGMD